MRLRVAGGILTRAGSHSPSVARFILDRPLAKSSRRERRVPDFLRV